MKRSASLMLMLVLFVSANDVRGEQTSFTKKLFDGKTLNGWKVANCEAEVDDGTIFLKAGNGIVRTENRYTDFILELEWKALRTEERWDSGIYFRCELPEGTRPWPKRYQANLLKGQEGNVGGIKDATSTGLVKDGEWNHFKLSAIGTKVSLDINGKKAYDADGLEDASGYICLQAEVPGGGQFRFRNIQITEVGHTALFNGKDLTGFEGAKGDAAECWAVEDGVLVGLEKKGPWLRTLKQYDDFNLRLDYKVQAGGNSGVYCRVPEDGNHHGKDAGVEIQILDDTAEKHAKLDPYQYCGSVYAIAPPTNKVGRAPGEWNSMEINCAGHSYKITHNGEVIVDATLEKFPQLEERLTKGFLGLQNHGGGVCFRDIRIGPPQP